MAQGFGDKSHRNFWSEVRKLRSTKTGYPTSVDGVSGNMNISNIFHQKYEQLYNSVSYNRDEIFTLKWDINEQIINHHNDNCNSHTIMSRM